MTCDCADNIVSWWENDEEGQPVLHINDERVPPVCPRSLGNPVGGDYAVVASAVIESRR